ncbi:hypothetical protein [Actinocorallia longicatena]|uniref:hypothetical protein n=1 Tax=Actinocorallia longicatena TaxID=111803 RepID=UPI0031CEC067
MEAFESFVALSLEHEGFVVSEAVKFPVRRQTRKRAYREIQTHGYEVDLVAARGDRLVLATVKSYFGSRGVAAEHVIGETANESARNQYVLLNNPEVQSAVLTGAGERYGYPVSRIQLHLYVGKFAGQQASQQQGRHETRIRQWCSAQNVGAGPIKVYGVLDVVEHVRLIASRSQYRDNPVLVTLKVLEAAGLLPHLE